MTYGMQIMSEAYIAVGIIWRLSNKSDAYIRPTTSLHTRMHLTSIYCVGLRPDLPPFEDDASSRYAKGTALRGAGVKRTGMSSTFTFKQLPRSVTCKDMGEVSRATNCSRQLNYAAERTVEVSDSQ